MSLACACRSGGFNGLLGCSRCSVARLPGRRHGRQGRHSSELRLCWTVHGGLRVRKVPGTPARRVFVKLSDGGSGNPLSLGGEFASWWLTHDYSYHTERKPISRKNRITVDFHWRPRGRVCAERRVGWSSRLRCRSRQRRSVPQGEFSSATCSTDTIANAGASCAVFVCVQVYVVDFGQCLFIRMQSDLRRPILCRRLV